LTTSLREESRKNLLPVVARKDPFLVKKKGFTLAEVIVVVVILGVISTLALVQFQKTLEVSRQKKVEMNLNTMYAAYSMKVVKQGIFTPAAPLDLPGINSLLNLSIPTDDRVTYSWPQGSTQITATIQ